MSVYRILSSSSFISDTPLYVVLSCWHIHKAQHTKRMVGTLVLSSFLKPEHLTVPRTASCCDVSVTCARGDVASTCVGVGLVSAWEGTPCSFLVQSVNYSFKLVCRHVCFSENGPLCSVQTKKSPSSLQRVVSSKSRNYRHWRDLTHYCT